MKGVIGEDRGGGVRGGAYSSRIDEKITRTARE